MISRDAPTTMSLMRRETLFKAPGVEGGTHPWFRPVCPACTACQSLRIPLATFTPSRSQRRALRGNATIEVVVQAPTISGAHLRLYNAYHAAMHRQKGWPWHPTDPVAYFQSYIGGDWAFAREFLYYDHTRLVGVALADI
jgi:arginine-tRNA-protein transferase